MKHLEYTLQHPNQAITPGRMAACGGQSPYGEQLGFTNYYMTRNQQPYIPVVGEFHYSRFSYLHWEEELLKMKAGGIEIVATYVFWIMHEELEGEFSWEGNLNLRHFVDLCAKHGLKLIVRIGPFCHGEVRNGGMPDWLFSYPLEVRSNDERYLHYVTRLYQQIARQLEGRLFQQGGPIIAVQLENEYMHAGAPLDAWGYSSGRFLTSGRDGQKHLERLRQIAEDAGIRPLFFTATAWGGAAVPEQDTLPMLAGYAYTPWIPNQPPSGEYIFRNLHETPAEPVDYDTREYPAAYCELAGGMQVSYKARPVVEADSVEAMSVVKLANGSNLIGYYMYHGGSNPIGKRSFMNESGLPKITYDYQSPLGEFGRVGDSYHRIRLLSLFLQSFGHVLAPMGTVLPDEQENIVPEDTASIRWSLRQHDHRGFVFLNNFQDHVEMPEQELALTLHSSKGSVRFPSSGSMKLTTGSCMILPFHLDIAGLKLVSATVQPLTVLEGAEETAIVCFAREGIPAEYVLEQATISGVHAGEAGLTEWEEQAGRLVIRPQVGKEYELVLTLLGGKRIRLITLSREEALQAYRLRVWGEDRLIVSEGDVYVQDEQLVCTSEQAQLTAWVYPAPPREAVTPHGELSTSTRAGFEVYEWNFPAYDAGLETQFPAESSALLTLRTDWPSYVADVRLHIDYDGDVAAAYIGQRLLTDHIHYGKPWSIGLKQIRLELAEEQLHLSITPLRKGTVHSFVNQAYIERFKGVEIALYHHIEAIPCYRGIAYLRTDWS